MASQNDADPDPGRRLMVVALIGAAVLALAVIAAMGYFVWQRIRDDDASADVGVNRVTTKGLAVTS
jgi:hypothetical protein